MARILVIDDNQANLDLMSFLLQASGHVISTAQDGEEGLVQSFTQPPVDLIVCDVHMPRVDGYEVARRLRADAVLRSIPLVAVTALAMVGDKEKVLAAGFDGYIPKPINPREFAAQVQAYLPGGTTGTPSPWSAAPADEGPATPRVCAGHGERILVVDDLADNRDLARATLEPHGYHVTAVGSVAEACACLEHEAFDLVLSDLHMPDHTGLHLLSTIRDDPRWQQLPFVLTSSSLLGISDREQGRALRANRFLTRPVGPRKILKAVADCLEERKEKGNGQNSGR